MTIAATGREFMGLSTQLFRRSLGEALSELARQKYPRDTAKRLSRAWGIDPKTAANVVQGHVSERTITKALAAEGWALLAPLGQAITGETFEQFEERRLQSLIQEAEQAHENLVALRTRRAELDARAGQLVASRSWPPSQREGRSNG